MASDMSFWSLEVKGGSSETVEIEQTVDICRYIHINNLALAPGSNDVPCTLSVVANGTECVLATLSKAAMQYPLQMICDGTCTFKNSGKASLHLSGFSTTTMAGDDDDDMGMMGSEDEDEDEDEDEVSRSSDHQWRMGRSAVAKQTHWCRSETTITPDASPLPWTLTG